ncbi:L,D-transpeptidase family protein [Schaalia suimastitidis]|uniref:L,D-transpeptidase family protein n=1 Tax=Schaalia suimastitidis TaxID=121163 RepID=UPI0003FC2F90|nr:L,D-transpeptidase family protein [Schaalia suimastitidis]
MSMHPNTHGSMNAQDSEGQTPRQSRVMTGALAAESRRGGPSARRTRTVARHAAPRRSLRIVPLVFTVLVASALAFLIFDFTAKIPGYAAAGVTVAGNPVGGMSREEIIELVSQQSQEATLALAVAGSDTTVSLAEAGVVVDAEATADAALAASHGVFPRLQSLFSSTDVAPVVHLDDAGVTQLATRLTEQSGTLPVDAQVTFTAESATFTSSESSVGEGVNPQQLKDAVTAAAVTLTAQTVPLNIEVLEPQVSTQEAATAATDANVFLAQEVTLTHGPNTYPAPAAEKAAWLEFKETDGVFGAAVNDEKVTAWIDGVVDNVNRQPINGIMNVDAAGNQLEPARPPKVGLEVTNRDAVVAGVLDALSSGTAYTGEVTANEIPAGMDNRVVSAGVDRFAHRASAGEKWVDVNLTDSTLTAYVGYRQVYGPILINHGGVGNETITGTYKVYLKYTKQDMGCTPEWEYCERDVPWVAYWYRSYALHGAPWVKEFGIGTDESSHGCVNIPVEDAHWIHDWVELGTTVVTHH